MITKYKDIEKSIVERISYIDTVRIWFPRKPSKDESRIIRSLCEGRKTRICNRHMLYQNKWVCRYILQQPSIEVFDYIHFIFGNNVLINRIDIALDLCAENYDDGNKIAEFIDRALIHLWHGDQLFCRYKNTSYSAKRKSRRNYARYFTFSKINGKPCGHIELRLSSSSSLKHYGFSDISVIKNINIYEVWEKHLQLRDICLEKLGKYYSGRTQRKKAWMKKNAWDKPYNHFEFIGNALMRSSRKSNHPPTIQELIDTFRNTNVRVKSCLIKIDNKPFLPSNHHL